MTEYIKRLTIETSYSPLGFICYTGAGWNDERVNTIANVRLCFQFLVMSVIMSKWINCNDVSESYVEKKFFSQVALSWGGC